jgi:hypothetical protein
MDICDFCLAMALLSRIHIDDKVKSKQIGDLYPGSNV